MILPMKVMIVWDDLLILVLIWRITLWAFTLRDRGSQRNRRDGDVVWICAMT